VLLKLRLPAQQQADNPREAKAIFFLGVKTSQFEQKKNILNLY